MSTEDLTVKINNALDLLQVITEDIEDNLTSECVGSVVKARVEIAVSSLYVLNEYLRDVCKKAEVRG